MLHREVVLTEREQFIYGLPGVQIPTRSQERRAGSRRSLRCRAMSLHTGIETTLGAWPLTSREMGYLLDRSFGPCSCGGEALPSFHGSTTHDIGLSDGTAVVHVLLHRVNG